MMRASSLLICFAVLAVAAHAGAENLLTNPSFEDVEDGRLVGWSSTGFDWYVEPEGAGLSEAVADESVVQGPGSRSVKLIGEGNRGIVRQSMRYQPEWGRTLRVSGWIKLQDTGSATANIGVSFIGDGEWLDEAGVGTSWQKSTADWEYFESEVQVPEGTTHMTFHCRSVKPNEGIMWFDNVALEPVEAEEKPEPPAAEGQPLDIQQIEPLVPIDSFERGELEWGCSAWGGAPRAELSVQQDGAADGEGFMRVAVQSATNNWITRHWNYDGPWDGLALSVRAVEGAGRVKAYFRCGRVVFNAGNIKVRPEDGWQTLTVHQSQISHAWGGSSEKDRQFDPDQITDLCIGYDQAFIFDVDQIGLDIGDRLAVRAAYTTREANLFSPGEAPVVRVEMVNGHRTEQTATLVVELEDYHGSAIDGVERLEREVTIPAREYVTQDLTLPAPPLGYHVATATLQQGGRLITPREVGICVLPEPSQEGRPFMGASGFGLGAATAEIGRKLGVQASEIFIDWHRCEPERGEFDFEHLEARLQALEEQGFEVTGMLHMRPDFVPEWATDDEHDFATEPQDYARFVEALVAHLSDRIQRWSICSEVDLAHNRWQQGLDGYVEMARAAAEGAKRADPDCVIGGVGVSGSDARKSPRYPVARALWERLGDDLDGMFFDLYASPRFFGPGLRVVSPAENDLEAKLREALEIVREAGPDRRIAIEEKGWAILPHLDVYNEYSRQMADYLARSFLVARSVDECEHYMWFQLIVRRLAGGQSYSLFRFEGDHANPRPAAAAYAFVAQFLAGVEQPRTIQLHRDLRAIVFAHGAGSRAALWTPLEETVSLEVDLPDAVRVTDLMGTPVELDPGETQRLELSGSPLYVYADGTPADELAARLSGSSFHLPAAALAFSLPRLDRARVQVGNQLEEPLSGQVLLSTPERVSAAPDARPVEVSAGGTAAVEFDLRGWPETLPRTPGAFEARLRTARHGEVRRAEEPTLWPVSRMAPTPTIDGDLSEYADMPPIELDTEAALDPPDAVANRLWTSTEDLSVRAHLAWDAENLYFAARVRDEAHIQEQTGSRIWTNDAIQFGVDPLNDATGAHFSGVTGYDANDSEFGFALTPDGPVVWQWHGAAEGPVEEAELAVVRGEEANYYELALPWSRLTDRRPEAGVAMGLNFIVLDADAPGKRAHYWMGLTEGIAGGKAPALFNTFVLR